MGLGTETDLAVTVYNRYGVPHELSGGALTDPLLARRRRIFAPVSSGARDLASAIRLRSTDAVELDHLS